MSEIAADDELHANHFPTAALQSRAADVGMWLFLATELMFFGPLFFAYAYGRFAFPEGLMAAARHTNMALGTTNTAVLLTSSLLMANGVTALERDSRRAARLLLLGTALLGAAFLAIKGIEYRDDWRQGLLPSAGSVLAPEGRFFFLLYFVMTGLHAVHLTVGVVLVLAFAWALAPESGARITPPRLRVLGLYWHFVDAVWIVLYPLLYLPGRNL